MAGLGHSIEKRVATTRHRVEAGVEVDVVEPVSRTAVDGDAESGLGLELAEVAAVENQVALCTIGDRREESGNTLGDQVVAKHSTGSSRD